MNIYKTIFDIPKMDCPSEEQMIRMSLDSSKNIKNLLFDLNERRLTVIHSGSPEVLLQALLPLAYGAKLLDSSEISEQEQISFTNDEKDESRVLKQLFVLNATMFIGEIVFGVYAQSTGLIADALDMFADASVYGLSLYAVGKAMKVKQRSAKISGYFQLILALGVFVEVIRRFFFGSEPMASMMMTIASVAFVVNVLCLLLLMRHRDGGVHMKASWIFSANDVFANAGVITAGILVSWSGSNYPDLIIGCIISFVVLRGAFRILKIAKSGEKPVSCSKSSCN